LGQLGQVPCKHSYADLHPDYTVTLFWAAASEVDQWSFLCTKDTLWTADGQFSALLTLNAPIGVVTALGFAGDGTMAYWR